MGDAVQELPANPLKALEQRDIVSLGNATRCYQLDMCGRYYSGTQYDHLEYDWNGN